MLRTRTCLVVIIVHILAGTALVSQSSAPRGPAGNGQSIVGRVTDSTGHAVPGVFVSAMRDPDEPGAPGLRLVSARLHSITDTHGSFRLENLPPDNYCIVAIPHNAPTTSSGGPNRAGYAITYYPGATKAADAKSVLITRTAGATANITLASARLSVIAGSVITSAGRPAAGATLVLSHGDGLFGLDSAGYAIRSDGTFMISGTPPGTYFLQMREGIWPPPRDVIPKVSSARVIVSGRDISDVRVGPVPMVRAVGRVIVDPAVRASMQPSALRVSASPIDFQGNPGPQRPGVVRDDLTFELRTWPGRGYIRAFPADEWIVSRVRLGGADVTKTGIDFRAGQDVSGLEIELVKVPRR